MKIDIKSRFYLPTNHLQEHAERRVHYAFDRIIHRIARVEVRLADINGPRGGQDKQCRMTVHLSNGARVAVREKDACVYRAVDRATTRLKRLVKDKPGGWRGSRRSRETIRQFKTENLDESNLTVSVAQ